MVVLSEVRNWVTTVNFCEVSMVKPEPEPRKVVFPMRNELKSHPAWSHTPSSPHWSPLHSVCSVTVQGWGVKAAASALEKDRTWSNGNRIHIVLMGDLQLASQTSISLQQVPKEPVPELGSLAEGVQPWRLA